MLVPAKQAGWAEGRQLIAEDFPPLRQTDKRRRLDSLFGGSKRGDGSRAPRSAASLQIGMDAHRALTCKAAPVRNGLISSIER